MNPILMMFFVMCLFLPACKKEHVQPVITTLTGANGLTYSESLEKWNALKKVNGNSYVYQSTFLSWTGTGTNTEIHVENGIVVMRKFEQFETDSETGLRTRISGYTEKGSGIGHNERGAPPFTIDELYATCARDYLIADTESNTLLFSTDSGGLMTACGYIPHGCLDDCFQGLNIYAFGWLD